MRRPGALTLLVLILAGCAGDGAPSAPTRSSRVEPARDHADTRRADPAAVRVIRAWVSAERLSEPRQAASLFAVPAVVYNGGKPLLLEDRVAVREFNETLPCGAVLLRAANLRGWTVARFRLIERPGASCASVGRTASTAFGVVDGRIAAWIRVSDRLPAARALPVFSPRETLRRASAEAARGAGRRRLPPGAGPPT